ncbi:MAG: hypothetical protein AAB776_01700 [Patescibacteria group bacterium]
MSIPMLIVYTLVVLTFSWLLFNVGRAMLGTQSMRASLERYQKNPKQASWVEKYFYGWAFPWQAGLMKRMTAGTGDSFMTVWLKLSGLLFIIFAIAFAVGVLVMWYMNLIQA